MSKTVTVYTPHGEEYLDILRRGLRTFLPEHRLHLLVTNDIRDVMRGGKLLVFVGSSTDRWTELIPQAFDEGVLETLQERPNTMFVITRYGQNVRHGYMETNAIIGNAPVVMLNYSSEDPIFDRNVRTTTEAFREISRFLAPAAPANKPPARQASPPPRRREPSPPPRRREPSPPPHKPAASKLKVMTFEEGVTSGRLIQVRAERAHLRERIVQLDREEEALTRY